MAKKKKDFEIRYKEETNKRQKTFEKIMKDLNTNPKYNSFFNQYNVNHIDKFKVGYARYKTDCLEYAKLLKELEIKEVLAYQDLAVDCLWDIQYFKLFQLICQWHAKEISLPKVKYSHDFYWWQMNIEKCSFIPPITAAEVDIYLDYLQQAKDPEIFYFDWRNHFSLYTELRGEEEWKRKRNKPYFQYMVELIGTEFMEKPDIRGAKEKRFLDAFRAQNNIDLDKRKADPNFDHRPCIFFNNEDQLTAFVNQFDDKKYLEFKQTKHFIDSMFSEWDTFDESIELLKEAGDDWPVDYHEDWHEAIINAANQYRKQKVMKVLPKVFEEYQFRLANNIKFRPPNYSSYTNRDTLWYKRLRLRHLKIGMEYLGEKFVPD